MLNFKKVQVEQISDNPFKLIGKDWMLITSGTMNSFNTMTASWGGVGVLWKKNVCFLFVRKSRYTYEFLESNDTVTLSFFSEEYRKALSFCGANSGRDVDKCKETGLIPCPLDKDSVTFEQARLVLNCKKLYYHDITPDNYLDPEIQVNYSDGDFHRVYVCEITNAYENLGD